MGARAQFEVNELQSFYATDGVGKLYFWDASSMKALRLLLFITVGEPTKHRLKLVRSIVKQDTAILLALFLIKAPLN